MVFRLSDRIAGRPFPSRAYSLISLNLVVSLLAGSGSLLASSHSILAQQLIANGVQRTASGTYDTGSATGSAGYALTALNNGIITSTSPLTLITRGAGADVVNARSGGSIFLFGGTTVTSFGAAPALYSIGIGSLITAEMTKVTTTANNAAGIQAESAARQLFRGGSITTSGVGAHGAFANRGNIELNGVKVNTTADRAIGLYSTGNSSKITAANSDVSTNGASAHAAASDNSASLTVSGGTLSTTGIGAHGAFANGGAMDVEAAEIATKGRNAVGLYSSGSISKLRATNTKVVTSGAVAHAAVSDTLASLTVAGGTLSTTGSGAHGAFANGGNIELNGVKVNTAAEGAIGLYSTRSTSKLTATNSNVSTNGAGAHAAVSDNSASLTVSGGSLTTTGSGAHGAFANGGNIDLNGTSITTKANTAIGIYSTGSASKLTATNSNVSTNGAGAHAATASAGASLSMTGGSLSTNGINSHGAIANNGKLEIADALVNTQGQGGAGLFSSGSNGLLIAKNTTVTARGAGAHAATASAGASLSITGGSFTTAGKNANGVSANGGRVELNGTEVATTADQTYGLYASGNTATLTAQNSNVTSNGVDTVAAYSRAGASLSLTGGTLTASGNGAYAALADSGKLEIADAAVFVQGQNGNGLFSNGSNASLIAKNTNVTTHGTGAYASLSSAGASLKLTGGLLSTADSVSHGAFANGGTLELSSVKIATSGATSSGLVSSGNGSVLIADNVVVTTAGVGAHGAFMRTNGTKLSVSNSSITTKGADAAAFYAINGTGSLNSEAMLSGTTLVSEQGAGILATSTPFAISLQSSSVWGSQAALQAVGGAVLDVRADASTLNGAALIDGSSFINLTMQNQSHWQITGESHLSSLVANGAMLKYGSSANLRIDGAAKLDAQGLSVDTNGFNTILDSGFSGTGSLTKLGAGQLTLSGQNSYLGDTVIDGGEVAITEGGSVAAKSIVNKALLTVAGSSGDVIVNDGGKLNVLQTGKTSNVLLNGGFASINGLAANTTIGKSGMLGGIGTVGSLIINTGGIVSPGNSVGEMKVSQDVTFASGSVYDVEIAADKRSADTLSVAGKANLLGGAVTVKMAGDTTHLSEQQTIDLFEKDFDIVTARQGIEGKFDQVTPQYNYITSQLDYSDNKVVLSFQLARDLELIGATSLNQRSVGEAIKSLGFGNELFNDLLFSEKGVIPDYDQLSGEAHATLAGVLVSGSNFISDAATARVRTSFSSNPMPHQAIIPPLIHGPGAAFAGQKPSQREFGESAAFWGQVYGTWSHADTGGNASGYSGNSGGIVTGFDGMVADTWRVGLLAGYGTSAVTTRYGKASTDSYQIGVYGGTQWDVAGNALGVRLGVNLGRHEIETDRWAQWFSTIDHNRASYGASSVQGFGEVGYAIDTPYGVFEPFAGISHVHLKMDSFTETGGRTALSGRSGTTDVTMTTLGLRASHLYSLTDRTPLTARGMVGWNHAYTGGEGKGWYAFAGGDEFAIRGLPIAQDALSLEAGVDISLGNTKLGLNYTGQFSSHAKDNAIKANLSVAF